MLKNIMESLIIDKLDEIWNMMDACKCDKCKSDIVAYTLNQLPPKYVVTDEGELYAKVSLLSKEQENELTIALAKAIKMVAENPKH